MFVSAKGSNFQIESETKHQSPTAAARECAERVAEALAQLG